MSSHEAASALRGLVEAAAAWLREERTRVGESAGQNASALLRELGYVSRSEYEELALRVAQLEHRLRLLESTHNATDGHLADAESRTAD